MTNFGFFASLCAFSLGFGIAAGISQAVTDKNLAAADATIKHQDQLAEGLIKGEAYTVVRKEGEDTVRYIVGSCVKKEIQMFVPLAEK